MDRFFVEGVDFRPGARLALPPDEAHHARVKRLEPGARVRLFDGAGREAAAAIVDGAGRAGAPRGPRGSVWIEVLDEPAGTAPPPRVPATVGLAIPKGKRALSFLEKATELGAAAIFPLVTDRTVGGAREAEAAVGSEKWRRATIEAAKQSGTARLPELRPPRTLAEVLAAPRPALALILDPRPAARPLREALAACAGAPPAAALVLVGPEGGFTDAEVAAAAAAGFVPARLGPAVLRIETAALAALAAIGVAFE